MYQKKIAEILAGIGRADVSPVLIEAWMRLEHGTLDALSPSAFAEEARIAVACVDLNPGLARAVAASYGPVDGARN